MMRNDGRRRSAESVPAVMTALALAWSGCGADAPPLSAPEVIREGVADLAIGRPDGEGPEVFGRVSGVAEDGEGRIYVADALNHEVRVFDSDGAHLFSIGGRGEGPGELESPCCPSFDDQGRLWVRDGGNRRYAAFTLLDPLTAEGVLAGETRPMRHWDPWRSVAATFDADGRLVDVGMGPMEEGSKAELRRYHVSAEGRVEAVETLSQPTQEDLGSAVREEKQGGSTTRMYFPQPYGPQHLSAHGPRGAWAAAIGSAYRVDVHATAEDSWILTDPALQPPPLSEAEKDRGEARRRQYLEEFGGSIDDFPTLPTHKPVLEALAFDQAGRLWVFPSVADGAPRRARIYERDRLVEERTWPLEVRLTPLGWLAADHALGLTTDALGTQKVVRIRFAPPS